MYEGERDTAEYVVVDEVNDKVRPQPCSPAALDGRELTRSPCLARSSTVSSRRCSARCRRRRRARSRRGRRRLCLVSTRASSSSPSPRSSSRPVRLALLPSPPHSSSSTAHALPSLAGLASCAVEGCGLTSNLWLCLVCGALGCGRQQFGGGGGNGHALKHTSETGHAVAVKQGTIEPDGSAGASLSLLPVQARRRRRPDLTRPCFACAQTSTATPATTLASTRTLRSTSRRSASRSRARRRPRRA